MLDIQTYFMTRTPGGMIAQVAHQWSPLPNGIANELPGMDEAAPLQYGISKRGVRNSAFRTEFRSEFQIHSCSGVDWGEKGRHYICAA